MFSGPVSELTFTQIRLIPKRCAVPCERSWTILPIRYA
jgi:hypothetical protein